MGELLLQKSWHCPSVGQQNWPLSSPFSSGNSQSNGELKFTLGLFPLVRSPIAWVVVCPSLMVQSWSRSLQYVLQGWILML